jgi:hypothetical protein
MPFQSSDAPAHRPPRQSGQPLPSRHVRARPGLKQWRKLPLAVILSSLLAACGGSDGDDTLVVEQPMAAPEWAGLQRELLAANATGARAFAEEFLDERGYLTHETRWGGNDGPDDAMENLNNWTLAYALGSPESVVEDFSRAWEGHIRQFTEAREAGIPMAQDGMFYREFITSFDWEHTGEGLAAFYHYGLGKPNDPKYRERVLRFTGFFNGDDAEAQNYDPARKLMKSLHIGSRGPKLDYATEQDWGGLPVPGQPERLTRYATAGNIVGDHPLNLGTTTLGMTAYMLTGEDKYRNWVLEYSGAWRDRILQNGGNIPTNIGLDGTIGGEWNGKWYGGAFGWDFDPGQSARNYYMRGVRIGMGNSMLLTGDQGFAEPLRAQIGNLLAASRMQPDGSLLIPNKYGDQGWYGYGNNHHNDVQQDLFLWSMNDADKERIKQLGWMSFLAGTNPNYPVTALRSALQQSRQRVQAIANDPATVAERWQTWRSDAFAAFNPVSTSALVNLMLGGNDPGTSGNTLHSRLRYFDPAGARAGVPADVAALVTAIAADSVSVTLVNTGQTPREVILQAGAYGEHRFTDVAVAGRTQDVNANTLRVRLAPGAGADLQIGMARYTNKPTLLFPWNR